MDEKTTNEIIDLLPSKELRKTIRERKTVFSDIELLKMAFDYAPNYESRLDALGRLYENFSGEIKEYTGLLIERQKFCLEEFLKAEENAVFELHIKDTPDSYDERYLASSYESALKLIPLFHKEYECEPTDETVYTIVKRKIFRGDAEEPFSEDYLGQAALLSDGKLFSVDVFEGENEPCLGNHSCVDCSVVCISNTYVEFPRIIERGDLVKFRDGLGQPERFGVVWYFGDGENVFDYYTIPLDCADIRYHNFTPDFWDHEHALPPLTRKISPDELSEKMRADYLAFTEFLKKTDNI